MKKVLVSGVQSSGALHIGNYFGAIKQNIELGNSGEYDSYIFIADYHSMTTLTDARARRKSILDTACTYLACGLDVNHVALFKQSDVPEHTELAWILDTVTPVAMLNLAHAFKSKVAEDKQSPFKILVKEQEELDLTEISATNINAGLFNYPVLMAADILIYNADIVPVGADQQQHVEMAREIAGKYNRAYAKDNLDKEVSTENFYFKMPQAFIKKGVETVPGLDGTKMSKSKGNVIPLFGSDEVLKKSVFDIVTDSASPTDKKIAEENNIYKIHSLFLNEEQKMELKNKFENSSPENPYGYKQAKDELLETIIRYISPMREKYDYYQANPDVVRAILSRGAEVVQAKAKETMKQVRMQTGLDF